MTHHVVPVKVYLAVFVALMVLMAATVAVAYFLDLGPFNDVVAMLIAMSKTLLIMLYFMHLRYSSRLTQIVALTGFLFLVILVGGTLNDYFTRGDFSEIAPTLGNPYDPLGE